MGHASALRARGLRAKKSFGQNFLDDPGILARIASLCGLSPGAPVVEIGAGMGALTAALAATGAKVWAVERDRDLVPVLRERFGTQPAVTIMEANAMALDLQPLHDQHGPLVVCGNLPYHLTSPLLFHLMGQRSCWRRVVVMVQKEVALRMEAEPGTRIYGLLSVMLGARVDVSRAFDVPPGAFHPRPKVTSSVVLITPRSTAVPGADLPAFRSVARAAFSARRKTLRNGLKALGLDTDALLAAAGVDGGVRAETLSVEDFGRLALAAVGLGFAAPQAAGAEDEDGADESDAEADASDTGGDTDA